MSIPTVAAKAVPAASRPTRPLQAPFPYFGGKSRAARLAWSRFGDVRNYVEPFFGSGAILLGRPEPWRTETVNDADGFLANFWRAVQADPEAVAEWADWPVNECDLHARHAWLVARKEGLRERLEGDPSAYDAQIAGWWVWGLCCWIGAGWCLGDGPWRVVEDGAERRLLKTVGSGKGVRRTLPHLGKGGRGVHRKLPHLGDAGRGVHRKQIDSLVDWFGALSDRLRRVRVCCGDWSRVCGPTPTVVHGSTAVFLDPPYSPALRESHIYSADSASVAADAREWALAHGDDPRLRIALCGYEDEHAMPGWSEVAWKANGGYGSQGQGRGRANCHRERIWFSPHCLKGD